MKSRLLACETDCATSSLDERKAQARRRRMRRRARPTLFVVYITQIWQVVCEYQILLIRRRPIYPLRRDSDCRRSFPPTPTPLSTPTPSTTSTMSTTVSSLEPLFTLVAQSFATLETTFYQIPGSSVIARYVKSSHRDDPGRTLLEVILIVFAIRTLLQSRTKAEASGKHFIEFTEKAST